MTRFVNRQLNTLGALLFCALASVLLQGCGAERTTGFNPSTTSSSSSSSAAKVAVDLITKDTATYHVLDSKDKVVQVFRNVDDFYDVSNSYVSTNLTAPDFDKGQVILVDMGEQDSCKQHLEYYSLRAEAAGSESVKVVVSYREKAASSSTCTSVITRPYYFYYVDSRDQLIISEVLL